MMFDDIDNLGFSSPGIKSRESFGAKDCENRTFSPTSPQRVFSINDNYSKNLDTIQEDI